MPLSSKSSKSSKHRHISKVRLNKKAKNIKTQRNKKTRKTRIVQRGGFNGEIKKYYEGLNNQVNTYDLKLMLIYTYLNNPLLNADDKAFINECMKIESFGSPFTINGSNNVIPFQYISTLLGGITFKTNTTGVISISGRQENRNWHEWLSMQKRSRLPLPSSLFTHIQILKIKKMFNINGIMTSQTLDDMFVPIELPLTHFWFKKWPDHGVPSDLSLYCNFIKEIYKHILDFGGGSIIHCSAGVGRTGVVYITLNLLFEFGINPNDGFPLQRPHDNITIEIVLERIMRAREYRMMLVQTIQQFEFILCCFGLDEQFARTDTQKKQDIATQLNKSNPSLLLTQNAQLSANNVKNRYSNVLPYDGANGVEMVTTLQTDANPTGYINASFAPCFMPLPILANWHCPDFILSQCPIHSTITDFQNMIRLHNIRRIIMVTGLVELGKAKCDDYLELNNNMVYNNEPVIVNDNFKLYEYKSTVYGQIQEYTYTQIASRERAGSSNSV